MKTYTKEQIDKALEKALNETMKFIKETQKESNEETLKQAKEQGKFNKKELAELKEDLEFRDSLEDIKMLMILAHHQVVVEEMLDNE